MSIPANEALQRLREGNLRFVDEAADRRLDTSRARRLHLASAQEPFAIILGCSDSRVPAELVFDQGLGDLFVIRVAGNVVAPSQIGSVEFAAAQFGTQLVVVLGHSQCGAVDATVNELQQVSEARSPSLRSIVDRIRPAIEGLCEAEHAQDRTSLMHAAVRANVRYSVAQLCEGSEILDGLLQRGSLRIVGAHYDLASGVVDFLD